MALTFDELRENYDINELRSRIEFKIPYHLILPERRPFSFSYEGNRVKLSSALVPTNTGPFKVEHGYYHAFRDRYGLINHTQITIDAEYYLTKNFTPSAGSGPLEEGDCAYQEAAKIYNHFLSMYKCATEIYWLDEINCLMHTGYKLTAFHHGRPVFEHVVDGTSNICLSLNPLLLTDEQLDGLLVRLRDNDSSYWEIAVLHAKSANTTSNYRDAIIWTNIALENFTYIYSEVALSKHLSPDELKNFFDGNPEYESFHLKSYMTREQFQEAVEKGAIKPNPPSIHSIYRKVCKHTVLDRRRTKDLVEEIRKYRNDIIHGRHISDDILEDASPKAIDAFAELSSICAG